MKITFPIPPALRGRAAERLFGCTLQVYPQPNLIVLYAATVLKRAGHDVRVLDFPVDSPSFKSFRRWAARDDSDLYVLQTVPISAKLDLYAQTFLKRGVPVVWFGPAPTDMPEAYLLRDDMYVLRGEIEEQIAPLVEAISSGKGFSKVLGLTYRAGGKTVSTEGVGYITDINTLPIPDRTLLNYWKYMNPKLPRTPYTTMLTSRACNARCYYCVPMALTYARELDWKRAGHDGKPPVTLRTPENIREELSEIKRLGIRAISIVDDQFVWGRDRHMRICQYLKETGLPFGILARCDRLLQEDMVAALADAGCVYVDFGVESFDQEILDYIKKDMKAETVERSISLLRKYGIEPKINILYGTCPLETKETLARTLEKVKSLDVDFVQFAVTSPFPGTEFREQGLREGWVKETDVGKADPSKRSLVAFPNLSQEYLDHWVRHSFRSFYLRPRIIWRRLRKLSGWTEAWIYLRGLLRLIA
ncbi:radical SAM protein [Candidatus Woesearchaeota archaeon]|nr:radical SAM protein [Candidatus Woesearchaeota archaeon]